MYKLLGLELESQNKITINFHHFINIKKNLLSSFSENTYTKPRAMVVSYFVFKLCFKILSLKNLNFLKFFSKFHNFLEFRDRSNLYHNLYQYTLIH